MDKDEFKQKLAAFFEESKVKTVRKLEPGMITICTRGTDFDPKTNELWDHWDNKSEVRDDVRCCGCCEALAVSNWVYKQYIVMKEKPRPYCMECAGDVIQREAEAEKAAEAKKQAEGSADPNPPA
jgi:hypothetical protein